MTVSKAIKHARSVAGMKQQAVAYDAEISQSTVSVIETRPGTVTFGKIVKVLELLEIKLVAIPPTPKLDVESAIRMLREAGVIIDD